MGQPSYSLAQGAVVRLPGNPDARQIPHVVEILAKGIDAINAARPQAQQHFNSGGRYSHLAAGWRGQLALHLRRLGDEARAARLPLTSGQALRDLAASEYETTLPQVARGAVGHVELTRSGLGEGVIRQGTVFRKEADPNAQPIPIVTCEYETVAPVYVPANFTKPIVQVRARTLGSAGNVVQQSGVFNTLIGPAQPLFDATLTTFKCFAGGGAPASGDPELRAAAAAYADGQYAPTKGAVTAGALRVQGSPHFAYFDYLPDIPQGALAQGLLFVADPDWGSSPELANEVGQAIADSWLGFVCRVAVWIVVNQFVKLDLTVRLQRSQYLFDTTDIQSAISDAIHAYFDDRPDWYTWRLSALRAAVTSAHRKILSCASATVSDFSSGTALPEPPTFGTFGPNQELTHFYPVDRAVAVTFLPPT